MSQPCYTPKPISALIGVGEPERNILVVDPGRTVGLCSWSHATRAYSIDTAPLEGLPGMLHYHIRKGTGFIAVEDYRLVGGNRANAGATEAPAAIGIGMCRTACVWTDTPMYLIGRNAKRAGHMALDHEGQLAYQAARNAHERDAIDLMGFVLREMRRPA